MLRYTLRRLLIMIPTLLVISFITFVIIQLPPGDFLSNQIAELQSQGDKAAMEKAEFLRRLMVKLGAPQAQAAAAGNVQSEKPTSRVASLNNQPVVVIDEGFDRAWRRVGLALDRTGFTVEDRDRSQGTYFVRYVEPSAEKKSDGFLAKLFRSESASPPVKYRIAVKSQGESSTVTVLNANGAPETSATAQRIVQVIADDLK